MLGDDSSSADFCRGGAGFAGGGGFCGAVDDVDLVPTFIGDSDCGTCARSDDVNGAGVVGVDVLRVLDAATEGTMGSDGLGALSTVLPSPSGDLSISSADSRLDCCADGRMGGGGAGLLGFFLFGSDRMSSRLPRAEPTALPLRAPSGDVIPTL